MKDRNGNPIWRLWFRDFGGVYNYICAGKIPDDMPPVISFADAFDNYIHDVKVYTTQPRMSGAWEGFPYVKISNK